MYKSSVFINQVPHETGVGGNVNKISLLSFLLYNVDLKLVLKMLL
jgi:hypothetical protein